MYDLELTRRKYEYGEVISLERFRISNRISIEQGRLAEHAIDAFIATNALHPSSNIVVIRNLSYS